MANSKPINKIYDSKRKVSAAYCTYVCVICREFKKHDDTCAKGHNMVNFGNNVRSLKKNASKGDWMKFLEAYAYRLQNHSAISDVIGKFDERTIPTTWNRPPESLNERFSPYRGITANQYARKADHSSSPFDKLRRKKRSKRLKTCKFLIS